VLVLSMNDAVRITPLGAWGRSMSALLEHLDAGRAPGAGILVAGVQPIASVEGFGGLAGWLGQRHADRLNATTRALLAELPGAVFTELGAPKTEIGRPAGSSITYETWAGRLADSALPLVAGVRPRTAPAEPWAEGPAVHDERAIAGLRELEQAAQRRFRVPLALVSLLDEERQYFPTGDGPVPSSVPRELTYCDVTAAQDAPLIVPDARKDPRFAGSGYIDVAHTPFYAGAPLHSPSGAVIGTFCLMGAFPRRGDRIDVGELQRFASDAERLLWSARREEPASPERVGA
jgi:GAF domain-containing protein